jgi:GntR family transcriptional repressor for pyruvate dehydrogenase complex
MESPLVEHAVAGLREMLAEPAFVAGGRLPTELALSERFSVSRPILRQALAILKDEGLIESRRGSGTFARRGESQATAYGRPETLGDLEDCLRFRMVIESAAAADAARRADAGAIAAIRESIDLMQKGSHSERSIAELDMSFHMAIARATGNRYPAMTLQFLMPHIQIGLQMGRQLRAIPANVTSRRVATEHLEILTAIVDRNPEAAAQRMNDHLLAGIERIFGKRNW